MNQNQVVTNNIIMNNYFTIGNSYNQKEAPKKAPEQKEANVDDLMNYFSTRYKNILPNRLNMNFDFKTMLFPFEKTQVVEMLYQFDILIQLLAQNFLFSTNEATKLKSYELLMKIYNQKNYVVSFLDYMPTYKVPLSKFKLEQASKEQQSNKEDHSNKCPICFNIKPQVSILQSPLLELTELFIEIKSKKLELIQQHFLTEKKLPEIKNRYKNLICRKANDNKIKRWKILQFAPLRDDEKAKLQMAFEWFGSIDRYSLFSRYFLVDRSPEFIQAELTGSENLAKKRKKYGDLLASNVFSETSPLPVLEIQIDGMLDMGKSAPPFQCQTTKNMEVEVGNKVSISPRERLQRMILDFSQDNNDKIVAEERADKIQISRQDMENFETEELAHSQEEMSSADEAMIQFSEDIDISGSEGRRFKKIGSEIFEYEEI